MSVAVSELSPVEQKLRNWKPKADIPEWFSRQRGEARDRYFDLAEPDRTDEAWHYGQPQAFGILAVVMTGDDRGAGVFRHQPAVGNPLQIVQGDGQHPLPETGLLFGTATK